jgi:hypothetical protein
MFLGAPGQPLTLRARQTWHCYGSLFLSRRVSLMKRPKGVNRIIQRAGWERPLTYGQGFCLRLPGDRVLIVHRRAR